MVELALIFSAAELTKSVVELTGLLDSIESKVDRLVRSELNAGLRALEQAAHATTEQVSLLREARSRFNKATSLEVGYRRAVALLGLSVTHHWLGDRPNSAQALEEILEIDPVSTLRLVAATGAEGVREFNPLKLLAVVRSWRVLPWKRTAADRDEPHRDGAAWQPLAKYRGIFTSRHARKRAYRELVLNAVNMSSDASAVRRVQEAVSRHIGKPVVWLEALE